MKTNTSKYSWGLVAVTVSAVAAVASAAWWSKTFQEKTETDLEVMQLVDKMGDQQRTVALLEKVRGGRYDELQECLEVRVRDNRLLMEKMVAASSPKVRPLTERMKTITDQHVARHGFTSPAIPAIASSPATISKLQ